MSLRLDAALDSAKDFEEMMKMADLPERVGCLLARKESLTKNFTEVLAAVDDPSR
jgi:hypothetical protein